MQAELPTHEQETHELTGGSWIIPTVEEEAALTQQIQKLWIAQKQGRLTARHTQGELRALRLKLSEMLHGMKAILVGSGRGGGWSAYLRTHKLPRATADRYVATHESTVHPVPKKCPTEATEEEVRLYARNQVARLSRVLTNQMAFYVYVDELVMHMPTADGRTTALGVEVLMPEEERTIPVT